MAAEIVFEVENGLLIANHPTTGIIVRSDGAVFTPVPNHHDRLWHWNYGIINNHGYMMVCINRARYLVHRIVAETFIHNGFNKPEVDHINRIRTNNCVENLRFVTRKENEANKQRAEDCLRKYGIRKATDKKAYMKAWRAEKSKDPEWLQKNRDRATRYYETKKAGQKTDLHMRRRLSHHITVRCK